MTSGRRCWVGCNLLDYWLPLGPPPLLAGLAGLAGLEQILSVVTAGSTAAVPLASRRLGGPAQWVESDGE